MIDPSALDDARDIAMEPWVLPAVAAGGVLAASVATACVCIFAISLPILPVLAACIVVAAALIGVIVWRIVSAKTGKQNLGGNASEGTEGNGGGNELGPMPDMEDIAAGGQGLDFSGFKALEFRGYRGEKPCFRGYWNNNYYFFTAESFDKALEKCSNITHLEFNMSVPEDLKIKAENVVELAFIQFTNILSVREINVREIFDVPPRNLNVVTFENCSELADATVVVDTKTRFICCGDLHTIRVGNVPNSTDAGSSSVLLGDDVFPDNGNRRNTSVDVEDCNSFNTDSMMGFHSTEETVTMGSGGISLSTKHSKSIGGSNFECSTKVTNFTGYRSVKSVKIFSEPAESGGKILFRLPEGLSAEDEVAITYHPQETDVVGKPVTLDFVPPTRIILASNPAAVKHIILTNKRKSNSDEKNKCIVAYAPSDASTVEFENFTSTEGEEKVDFYEIVNNGDRDVALPKIKLGGEDLSITWFQNGQYLRAIASKYADAFREQNKNAPLIEAPNNTWQKGTRLCFNASWIDFKLLQM